MPATAAGRTASCTRVTSRVAGTQVGAVAGTPSPVTDYCRAVRVALLPLLEALLGRGRDLAIGHVAKIGDELRQLPVGERLRVEGRHLRRGPPMQRLRVADQPPQCLRTHVLGGVVGDV